MGLKIVVLALFQDTGGHVLVLEPHIGQQGRGRRRRRSMSRRPLQILGMAMVSLQRHRAWSSPGVMSRRAGQEALRLGKEAGRASGARVSGSDRIFFAGR